MRVPVLMYHKVGAPVSTHGDRFLNVSPLGFQRQMLALKRLGYSAIPFSRLVWRLRGQGDLPKRSVVITFDDAYQCVYDAALPTLRALEFPATVFVVTGCVDGCNEWDRQAGLPILPIMTWDRIGELRALGWEIAAHTESHPDLGESSDHDAFREIATSREEISRRMGEAPQTFCYPFGRFNVRTPALVQNAGFAGACTTASGVADPATDPYRVPRVKVAFGDDVAGLLYRMFVRPHLPDMRRKRNGVGLR